MATNKFRLDQVRANFARVKQALPARIGNMGTRFFTKSFAQEGFSDDVFHAWPPRKGEIRRRGPGMVSSRSASGRNLLVKSGALRRAVSDSLKTTTFTNISFIVPLKYARVHNYGERAGRGRGFTMPRRQFMGNSKILTRLIQTEVQRTMKTIAPK